MGTGHECRPLTRLLHRPVSGHWPLGSAGEAEIRGRRHAQLRCTRPQRRYWRGTTLLFVSHPIYSRDRRESILVHRSLKPTPCRAQALTRVAIFYLLFIIPCISHLSEDQLDDLRATL